MVLADGLTNCGCLFSLLLFESCTVAVPLVVSPIELAIKKKKFSRDGMDVKMDAEQYEQNRSMISIGG